MTLLLLPTPQRLERRGGCFRLTGAEPVVLTGPADEGDLLAAGQLAEEVRRWVGRRPTVEAHGRFEGLGRAILLCRLDRASPPRPGLPPRRRLGEEGYFLEVENRRVICCAHSGAGLFYGVQTLRQLIQPAPDGARIPALRILDRPHFRYRGLMHDISRFKVPTLRTLFWLIGQLSHLKLNAFQLYTEHTFASRRHPEISAGCDPMTPEDLMTLDAVCRNLRVELQPNLQSFGHHQHLLSLPRYAHLAETTHPRPWTLTPVREETYRLLEDLYSEYLPCHTSPLFNADCDETWDLGKGQSAARARRIGVGRLYLAHIRRIQRLAGGYGKRTMIWADVVRQHLHLLRLVPRGMILLDWQYGLDVREETSRALAEEGLEHWVCPGTSAWCTLFAQVERARRNIRLMAEVGKSTGAAGLLNTDWGDDGHHNPLGVSLHGIACGAEEAWSGGGGGSASADFDRRFSWALFRDASGRVGRLFRLLGGTNEAFGLEHWRGVPFLIYWERFPAGRALVETPPEAVSRARGLAEEAVPLAEQLARELPQHALTFRECALAARQTIFACRKHELAAAVRREGSVRGKLRSRVRRLLEEWDHLRGEFEQVWMLRNRRSQISYRLGLYRRRRRDYLALLR